MRIGTVCVYLDGNNRSRVICLIKNTTFILFLFKKGSPTVFLLMYACPCISLYREIDKRAERPYYAQAYRMPAHSCDTVRRSRLWRTKRTPDIRVWNSNASTSHFIFFIVSLCSCVKYTHIAFTSQNTHFYISSLYTWYLVR